MLSTNGNSETLKHKRKVDIEAGTLKLYVYISLNIF